MGPRLHGRKALRGARSARESSGAAGGGYPSLARRSRSPLRSGSAAPCEAKPKPLQRLDGTAHDAHTEAMGCFNGSCNVPIFSRIVADKRAKGTEIEVDPTTRTGETSSVYALLAGTKSEFLTGRNRTPGRPRRRRKIGG